MEERIKNQLIFRRKSGNWGRIKGAHKNIFGYGSNLRDLNVKKMRGDVSALWGGYDSDVSGDMSMFSGSLNGIKATSREIFEVLNGNNKK